MNGGGGGKRKYVRMYECKYPRLMILSVYPQGSEREDIDRHTFVQKWLIFNSNFIYLGHRQ